MAVYSNLVCYHETMYRWSCMWKNTILFPKLTFRPQVAFLKGQIIFKWSHVKLHSGPFHGNWRDNQRKFVILKCQKSIQTSLFHHFQSIESIENGFLYKKVSMLSPQDLLIDQELTSNLKRAVVTDVTQRSGKKKCVNFPFVSLWIYWHWIYGSYIIC